MMPVFIVLDNVVVKFFTLDGKALDHYNKYLYVCRYILCMWVYSFFTLYSCTRSG